MSLEYALERYPMTHRLGNGSNCTIRPLKKSDSPRLREFLLAVPEQERMFIKFPVDDEAFLQRWCRQVDFAEHLPLLMLQGDRVIGEASLHQSPGGGPVGRSAPSA